MIDISPPVLSALLAHAAREAPRECCGLVVVENAKQSYAPCRNVAHGINEMEIDPADYAAASDLGDVVAICHSHILRPPAPTHCDLAMCEATGLPWVIVNHPTGSVFQFEPSGWNAPLIGCEFSHGINDCYGLAVRYFAQFGIRLPDISRRSGWWHEKDLFRDNYAAAGFIEVDKKSIRLHDMIVMKTPTSPFPNHCGVMVDTRLRHMLHHQAGKLSERVVYGGWYEKNTSMILRHAELNHAD